MCNIIGIDPGVSGGIALLESDGYLTVWDMPVNEVELKTKTKKGKLKKRKYLDGEVFADIIEDFGGVAYLEQVGPQPNDGAIQAFAFGDSYGGVRCVLEAFRIPLVLVRPQKWKATLALRKGKAGAALAAQDIFPGCHDMWHGPRGGLIDGRCEAALIAHYGRIMEDGK